jgi:hypothetical protein
MSRMNEMPVAVGHLNDEVDTSLFELTLVSDFQRQATEDALPSRKSTVMSAVSICE